MNKLNEIARFVSEHEAVSNNEISENLRISMPTVLQYTRMLKERGILQEAGKYDSTGGRKATAFSVAKDLAYAVGIEVRSDAAIFALTDVRRKLLAAKQYPLSFSNTDRYFRGIAAAMENFLADCRTDRKKVVGVGLALPGIVDRENALLLRSHALGVQDMSFAELGRYIGCSCTVENDANCAAFAELRGFEKNAVYLSLNDTVGGAIFMNGDLYRGDAYKSGEFGHMVLEENGKACYCGKRGCMDAYCSARILKEAGGGSVAGFFDALRRGDADAANVWQRYARYLALAVSNLRMAFDCTVVLGGEAGGCMADFFLPFAEEVKRLNRFDADAAYLKCGRYRFEAASFGATFRRIDRYFEEIV